MLALSHFPYKHVKAWSWNVMPEKATQVVLVHAVVSMPCWRAYQHVTNILSFGARRVLFILLPKPQRQEHPPSPTSHKSWVRCGRTERGKLKSHQAAQQCRHYDLGPSHARRSSHAPLLEWGGCDIWLKVFYLDAVVETSLLNIQMSLTHFYWDKEIRKAWGKWSLNRVKRDIYIEE